MTYSFSVYSSDDEDFVHGSNDTTIQEVERFLYSMNGLRIHRGYESFVAAFSKWEEPVGFLSFTNVLDPEVEISIVVAEAHRRRGVAEKMLEVLVHWLRAERREYGVPEFCTLWAEAATDAGRDWLLDRGFEVCGRLAPGHLRPRYARQSHAAGPFAASRPRAATHTATKRTNAP